MASKTFKELEHAGWVERAETYDNSFTPITNQAIDRMLDSFGEMRGRRLLDVACGPGHLAGRAAQRGAIAEGVDFAEAMVTQASANYPDVTFTEGDAEGLPYEDGRFDYVACAFGLLHVEHPETAMAEAHRVLRNGGRYTFTTWCSPDQGGDFLGLILGAVQAHGTLDVALPPAPPFFRFSAPDECQRTLAAVGFAQPATTTVPMTWHGNTAREALEVIYKSTVRTTLTLDAQTAEAREQIHQAILKGVEKYRVGERFEMAIPALMATAVKP